jgi:hypothetical protein
MKATWQRAVVISIFFGFIWFSLFLAFSAIFWRMYPYPENASQQEIEFVWAIHVLVEKLFGLLILALCAISAAVPLRGIWRIGFGAAIGSGLVYQAIAIITYIGRFGFSAYLRNNRFWFTIVTTIAISAIFGFIVVWKSYYHDHQIPPNLRKFRMAITPLFILSSLFNLLVLFCFILIVDGLHFDCCALTAGSSTLVISLIVAWLHSVLYPVVFSPEGIYGYSIWGRRHFVPWQNIAMVRTVRLLNLRWLRILMSGDNKVIWLALFQSHKLEFQEEIRRLAPADSPILAHLQ